MFNLTDEQIAEISSAKPGPELTKAVQKICCSASLAFPILRIVDQQLEAGERIEMRGYIDVPLGHDENEAKICLIGADGKVIARGDGLQEMLVNAVMTLC